jgi:uncharacterized protein YfaS (alpha-2-macroglobulin family)
MAASSTKSKFSRSVSFGLFSLSVTRFSRSERHPQLIGANPFYLLFALLLLMLTSVQLSHADDGADAVNSNSGFFILADHSFSSSEQAQVRLELQNASDVQAIHHNGGLDIAVYKVPNPIGFLQAQTNLHRINLKAVSAQSGLWNSVVAIWDRMTRSTRLLWRALFSEDARRGTVVIAPDLHVTSKTLAGHPYVPESAYKPLVGFDLIARFRYPVQFAKDIPSADAELAGANVMDGADQSDAVSTDAQGSPDSKSPPALFSHGNVYVPIGKLAPGLYIVEAMLGDQRAVTMVFVGDTVAVNKISASELLVWTVNRVTGAPVADVSVHWNDGTADLSTAKTTAQGLAQMQHASPEKTYVYAQDAQGGVMISENFYYDSEIYNTKLYATTDRPLYHPGDTVQLKVVGREFLNARDSKVLTSAPIQISVLDPNGLPVAHQTMAFDGKTGGQAAIQLPSDSNSGGYEIQLTYLNDIYSAAFRVANYQKPHFEINLVVNSKDLKTNQTIPVVAQLRYPDGKPVQHARVDLDLKAQALSMVEGDLGYGGLFPIKLSSEQYTTDADGNVTMTLPPVKSPSRYVVSVLATDGAAYRVRHTQELLIERANATWKLTTAARFSAANQDVLVNVHQLAAADSISNSTARILDPVQWKMVRLEDNATVMGHFSGSSFTVKPDKAGSYTISLLAADGSILGATSHWVSGAGLQVPSGHIEVVWDKDRYQVGDVANGLMTFSEPVDQALLTLERDHIEGVSLLNKPANWLTTEKVSPQQWRVHVPVTEMFAPNLTLSVAYVKHDQFLFENAGLVVASPAVDVSISANKAQYAPGEQVTLTIQTHLQGQPIPAAVSLGVVDEMIYVLQPEIAPDIHDFFYHPRRNNVRTQYSPSFIGYDLSSNQLDQPAIAHSTHDRAIKVLERPRRDEVDTAYWAPQLTTDDKGQAQVTFTMPDSLTRWRVTARAMTANGVVGQSIAHILSNKDLYLKWTSPHWLQATGNIAIFNQTNQEQQAQLSMTGALVNQQNVSLQPGINFVDVARGGQQMGTVTLALQQQGQIRDRLNVDLATRSNGRLTHFDRLVNAVNHQLTLGLPTDATHIRLRWLDSPRAAFYRVMDNLIEQPFGCAEQTASRMIPLAFAYRALPVDDVRRNDIARQLYTQRLRLASMAGDEAKFGWWGTLMPTDSLVTFYAYYADWWTAQTLGLSLPAEHWQRLLDIYSTDGVKYSYWQRALMLDWMRQIGLPVGSMVQALANEEINAAALPQGHYNRDDSLILNDNHGQTQDLALVLTSRLLQATNQTPPAALAAQVTTAVARIQAQPTPIGLALLQSTGLGDRNLSPSTILEQASGEYATIDRSVMLTWLYQSLANASAATSAPTLPAPWSIMKSSTGNPVYKLPDRPLVNNAVPNPALPTVLTADSSAVISYDSAQHSALSNLPATLTHQLYLLKLQSDGSFEAKPVTDQKVDTDALYLDTYTLNPKQKLHYMVIEASLPAGAQVETSTWGVKINGMDLARANYQDTTGGYVVPVGDVDQLVTVQHLLRFSQRGRYVLPAARAYNMYHPDAQVLDAAPLSHLTVK